MSENENTVPVNGTEGKMRECAENEENFAGRVETIRCNKATTMTTTVIPTRTTTNKVFDTHKQTSTSGEVSDRNTNKPTSKHPATTSTTCGGISEQHISYLKDNLDMVREKCREFHACTVELYKSENLHRILAGDNIQLRNICGLLYQNANGSYRILDNQCSAQERESIKELMGEELSPHLEGSIPIEGSWGKLKTCLDNTPGDSTYLDKLCRLKGNSTLPPLCNSTDVQTTTETFFNDKLKQHHCICNTFTDSSVTPFPLGPLIGGVCGGSLILLTIIIIIVILCVRQRKLKRRLTTESKHSGKTTSPTDECCCSNQGTHNHSQLPETPSNRPAGHQPRSPERWIPTTTSHSDYDFLELLPDVACVYHKQQLPEHCHPASVDIQSSPQHRPYALAKHVAPSPASERKTRATEGPDTSLEEGTYFEKIDIKATNEDNSKGGYTPLGLIPTLVVRRPSADSEEGESCNPQYFELEPSQN